MWWKKSLLAVVVLAALALAWRFLWAMPAAPLSPTEFVGRYDYSPSAPESLVFTPVGERRARFSFVGYQGDTVHGYIEWPATASATTPAPVLIGISAMGHSAQRWWQAEYKDRPTITETHQIRAMAIAAGYAVVAIDNRFTDSRKDPAYEIDRIMWRLHVLGDKTDYEQMVHGTAMDLRLLLDKLALQPELDMGRISVAGYSMGAQVGFLLSGVDQRIHRLLAMVPPHLDDRNAVVAPKNAAPLIRQAEVLLLTANDDPYASQADNLALFAAIASPRKRHLQYDSGHVLPSDYVAALREVFRGG